jgi:hypothetical protein
MHRNIRQAKKSKNYRREESDRQNTQLELKKEESDRERKAIITRGESQTGRKRQEDQSDRRNEKLLLQVEEVRQAKENQ